MLSKYAFQSDQAFKSFKWDFKQVVDFIKYYAKEKDVSSEDDILVLELKEGIFLRSKQYEFSEFFDASEKDFSKISNDEWKRLTQDIKQPLNQYGDTKLVRFKIGF